MNIELKKLKIYPAMSEETTAFSATLFIDGKEICQCKNDGRGGQTDIQGYNDVREILEKANAFLKKQRKGEKTYDGYLEDFVDNLVAKEDAKKQTDSIIKKMDKKCLNHIVIVNEKQFDEFKTGKSNSFEQFTYKYKVPIAAIPEEQLKASLLRIKKELKAGEIIYNKNIPQGA